MSRVQIMLSNGHFILGKMKNTDEETIIFEQEDIKHPKMRIFKKHVIYIRAIGEKRK